MNKPYMELYGQIGDRVKSEREALSWSQADLSKESGVTQPRISEIEAGKKAMYLITAIKICDALNIPLDWLVKGDKQVCLYLKEYPQTLIDPYESCCTHGENKNGDCSQEDCPLEDGDLAIQSCKSPGRNGCGNCALCADWGDIEHQRKKDEEYP